MPVLQESNHFMSCLEWIFTYSWNLISWSFENR